MCYKCTCQGGGIYYVSSKLSIPEVGVLEARKMGKHKDQRDFDEGQSVMAR